MQRDTLSLNVSKAQLMLICTKPRLQNLRSVGDNICLNIRGKDLDVVQKMKYLGVQVDNSLEWKEQIKVTSPKVSKALGLLQHAKTFLPESSLRSLYFSIVEPYFCYCFFVWECSGSNTLLELQKLQNCNQLVFKSLNKQAALYICNLFQRNSYCSSRDLINIAADPRLPMYTASYGQNSFSYRRAML